MFLGFFFHLRRRGLAASVQEWLTLTAALQGGLADESLAGLYRLGRCLLVKSEGAYDLYDQCFAEYFRGAEAVAPLAGELAAWLAGALPPRALSVDERARLAALSLEDLRRAFAERQREQTERHDGGNRWIGTGGTSPFGHGGVNPAGVRVHGNGGGRSAVQVAAERRYQNLRSDRVLDTRQLGLALKSLRRLARDGQTEELDLDGTIAATAANGGDVDLVFRATRKNTVKLLLLMDVGGSMTAYARLSEQLFSAANSLNHFKEFRSLYFHNCPYDLLYADYERMETVPTLTLLHELDASWHVLIVGDAAMSPSELTTPGGCLDYTTHNAEPGLVWLARLRARWPRSAWLNPDPPAYWEQPSAHLVRRVFPEMFPLTLAGLAAAVRALHLPRHGHDS